MEDNKKILLSGKLSGTRTFSSELEKIESPDSIEQFLLMFSRLKFDISSDAIIQYINDDQELLEVLETIHKSEYISIFHKENFSKLFISIDSGEVFIIRLNKVSPAIIGTFISKEKPIKFAINSFDFIKWCNTKSIEIKNLLDIPTYIKLLTNDVDPFQSPEDYCSKYTNYIIDDNNPEKNTITICKFIYKFGIILSKAIEEFDLTTVNRLINENSYYEGNLFNNTGNCIITISYTNIKQAISSMLPAILEAYKNKAYIVSPLNRIAPTFKHDISKLIYEIYSEDLSIAILNELYNNNIPVKLNYETSQYIITCNFNNFNNIVTLLQSIFSEAFYTLFDQSPEIHMECIIKE